MLPRYTSVGCYPLLYIDTENNIYCSDCAEEEGLPKDNGHVNWEDESLFCDCGERIECAYPSDTEE